MHAGNQGTLRSRPGRCLTIASQRAQVSPCKAVHKPQAKQQQPGILHRTGSLVTGLVAALSLSTFPLPGLLLDAEPLSTNDLIEKLNTNILPKIQQQIDDLSKSNDSNAATEDLKKQLQEVKNDIGKLAGDVQAGNDSMIPGDANELQQDFANIKKTFPNFS